MALIANTYHIYNCKLPFHVLFIIQWIQNTCMCCVCVSMSLRRRSSKKQYEQRYTTFHYIYVTFCFFSFPQSNSWLSLLLLFYWRFHWHIVGTYMISTPAKPCHHLFSLPFFLLYHSTHIFLLLFMWLTCYENKVNVCKKLYKFIQFNSHFRSIFELV